MIKKYRKYKKEKDSFEGLFVFIGIFLLLIFLTTIWTYAILHMVHVFDVE
tara:strand:+ start:22988 stop:23137 length:150 start_codon:yes stop_codon:yes gene_type:complete